jgi:hypothetical protein
MGAGGRKGWKIQGKYLTRKKKVKRVKTVEGRNWNNNGNKYERKRMNRKS